MKKLSKKQQEIVDKINEGAELYHSNISDRYFLRHKGICATQRAQTIKSLVNLGVIELPDVPYLEMYLCHLTEQYKTDNKQRP
jgi:hypothetical protein